MTESLVLKNNSRIAVIGGGPAGSFFSIFALKMAKMIGMNLEVEIYEPKDFKKDGPLGCNRCGGVISELLVQNLAVEGIILPDSLVQRGINSYKLHTDKGSVSIETPSFERTIATIYRGGGPKGNVVKIKESFDKFLLNLAVEEGSVHMPVKIDMIEYRNGKPAIFSNGKKLYSPDLIVGALGIKSHTSKLFEDMGFGYKRPGTITASIAELEMDKSLITELFGNSIHLFLLPLEGLKFAAAIPKETYVTLCLLGDRMKADTVEQFMENPVVSSVLPGKDSFHIDCRCLPQMNVRAPAKPYADRVVVCGDAGSTRLYKDGIGAAYIMGKAAARTAVFQGISREAFMKHYYPVYKSIITDNFFGKLLFGTTGLFRKSGSLTKAILEVTRKEQSSSNGMKEMSSILWDMFTGSERYKDIFCRTFNLNMNMRLLFETVKAASGVSGNNGMRGGKTAYEK